MNKRQGANAPSRKVEPYPRRPHRAMVMITALLLAGWIFFLLLVALRVI